MNLWRLELLRLVRTRRLLALFAVFLFFGLTAAPLARYMNEILARTGSGSMQVIAPPPTPLDGVRGYVSNAAQLGLLVFALVAAGALAVDAHRETAVFLRTRVRRSSQLVLPRYAVTWVAGSLAFTAGALAAWYGTAVLLGPLPAGSVVLGIVLAWVLLAFVGAVAAAFSARMSSVVGPTAATLGVTLALGIVGGVGDLGRWMPTSLLSALSGLVAGDDLSRYLPAVAVSLVATAALLALAVRLSGTREL